MLLPLVLLWYVNTALADVITNFCCGRLYFHIVVVDVVTIFIVTCLFYKVADVIALLYVVDGKPQCIK